MTSYFVVNAQLEYQFHGSYGHCRSFAEQNCCAEPELELWLVRARAGERHASLFACFSSEGDRQILPNRIINGVHLTRLKQAARRAGK